MLYQKRLISLKCLELLIAKIANLSQEVQVLTLTLAAFYIELLPESGIYAPELRGDGGIRCGEKATEHTLQTRSSIK